MHAECASIPVTLGLLKSKFIWAVLESYHESRDTLENFRAKSVMNKGLLVMWSFYTKLVRSEVCLLLEKWAALSRLMCTFQC